MADTRFIALDLERGCPVAHHVHQIPIVVRHGWLLVAESSVGILYHENGRLVGCLGLYVQANGSNTEPAGMLVVVVVVVVVSVVSV